MPNPQHARLYELFANAHACFAVCAVAELGIAEMIPPGEDRPVSGLAERSGCDEEHLYRTLRMLASHGFFRETKSRHFALTPDAEAMRPGPGYSTNGAWRMFDTIFKAQSGLLEALRSGGTPFFHAFGHALFAYLGAHPEKAPIFDAAMSSFHGPETQAMLDAYDFSSIATLADIGGGNGSLITEVLAKYPAMKGLLFDLDHVMGRAKANIAAAGLSDRCRIETGSFFESIPPGADAYLMRHIIHDWTDEQSVTILSNVRRVIPANGRLVLVEVVVPAGNDPSVAKDMDFLMLMYPGGKERTEQQYRALYKESGFELTSITPTSSMVCIIEGRPV